MSCYDDMVCHVMSSHRGRWEHSQWPPWLHRTTSSGVRNYRREHRWIYLLNIAGPTARSSLSPQTLACEESTRHVLTERQVRKCWLCLIASRWAVVAGSGLLAWRTCQIVGQKAGQKVCASVRACAVCELSTISHVRGKHCT